MDDTPTTSLDSAPLLGRAAVSAGIVAGNKIIGMYMPSGIHTQSFWQNGIPVEKTVSVTPGAARELQSQLEALNGAGSQKVFFDFDHEGKAASAWPERFFWQESPQPGVYHESELSGSGKSAVESKDYRTFSPVFHIERNKGNSPAQPAKIVCNPNANLNMGGFVNDPAFEKISPLWARNSGIHAGESEQEKQIMKQEEIDALKASNTKLQGEIDALKNKATRDAADESSLAAKKAEKEANEAKLEVVELKAKNKSQAEALHARNVTDAKSAVAAAVGIGAIAAQDTETQAAWERDITENPARAALLAKMPGNSALSGSRIGSGAQVGKVGPALVAQALVALQAANSKISDTRDKITHAKQTYALWAKDIRGNAEFEAMPLMAAAAADTLGTLSGTLVALRALELYKLQFPMLNEITTDYSDQPGNFDSATKTRIITVPAVMTYDATIDAATGRAKGWVVGTPATTTDVSITLDKHKAVEITFDSNVLASTVRNLFGEQSEAAAYALGKDIVDALYAKIIAGTFATNAAFTESAVDFGRRTFSKCGRILNNLGVPFGNRFALINSTYFEKLEQDPTLVSLAVYQKPEIITGSQLPPISRFTPIEAPNLPATGNMAAFFGHKSSLMIQSRVPNDYTTILAGAAHGNVTVVTNPDTGMSVLLVQYVNHVGGYAASRISSMYGVAAGNEKGGQIVKSA